MSTITQATVSLLVGSFAFFWFEVSNVSTRKFRAYYESNKSRLFWAPPGWLFGPAWGAWKIMIWLSFFFYARDNNAFSVDILCLWFINEVARKYWTFFFMDIESRRIALGDCILTFGTALALMVLLGIRGHLLSCLLLLGYTGWTLVACMWNYQLIDKQTNGGLAVPLRTSRLR